MATHDQLGRYAENEGLYGVTFDKQKRRWRVQAHVRGKELRLGRYKDRDFARAVADWVAILVKHRGAKRNFPVEKPSCWNRAEAEARWKLKQRGLLS